MKQSIAIAVTTFLLAVVCAGPAQAEEPSFTATPGTDQTVTLDASGSPCEFGPCGYNWKYYDENTNRLGIQMGREVTITFRFPQAGFYTVVLTVSGHCYEGSARACPRSVTMTVYAPPAETVEPQPVEPAPAAADPPPEVVAAEPAAVAAEPAAVAAPVAASNTEPAAVDPTPAAADEQSAVVDSPPAAVDAPPVAVDPPPAAADAPPA